MAFNVTEPDSPSSPNPKSGRWTVIAMFGFGILMVGSLWILFEVQTKPFRPLTEALHAEFPSSRPLVQGGKENREKKTPPILRVILTVPFDPLLETEKFQQAINTVEKICQENHDLTPYEQLEVHLIKPIPEHEAITNKILVDLKKE
jgi:hypothetical protein